MHLIDSHCHLDFDEFNRDRDDILLHCQKLGVKDIVIPGVTANSWQQLLTICQSSTMLHPALGLHPMCMHQHRLEHLHQLADYIADNHIIAIGEIGLDFYIPDHNKEDQIELFTEQLKMAQTAELPVLLHVRKAHDHTIHLLKQYPVLGGIVHAFNGSLQQAEHYQQLGFALGVGGAITHHRATRLRSLFSTLPLSSIVLETDAPDMPLSEMQGQRNSPENIPKILTCLADIRDESYQELALATTHNSRQVLKL